MGKTMKLLAAVLIGHGIWVRVGLQNYLSHSLMRSRLVFKALDAMVE